MNPGLHAGLRSGTRFGVLEQWGETIMECQQRRRPYSLKLAGHAQRSHHENDQKVDLKYR
jgi:hypothetical protein